MLLNQLNKVLVEQVLCMELFTCQHQWANVKIFTLAKVHFY